MKNKKFILIIALIALVAFITMPASAYTLLYENTSSTSFTADVPVEYVAYWGNMSVTRIEVDFHQTWSNTLNRVSGSYSGVIKNDGGTNSGNYTATWNLPETHASYQYSSGSTYYLNIDILDNTAPHSDKINRYLLDGLKEYIRNGGDWYVRQKTYTGEASVYGRYPWGAAGGSTSSSGDHTWTSSVNGTSRFYSGSSVVTPVSSFTCTPTSQYPDTSVVCTDSSTNTPTDWYWTIDAEAMGIDAWQTSTSRNFTWESHYPGFYSVNLRANNSAGNDWENKSNYVSISVNATPNNCDIEPLAGYVRTYAQTNDGITSGGIFNSDIQMLDVEGSAWSNVTNSGGWWCIDTLPGHSLNLYAQATGYSDVESIGVSANGGRHYLVMWPDYIPAPSAGNVTLYALIYDQQTGGPLYLSTVRVDGNTINTILKTTGPEGQAMFTIKNDTSIHVTASKSGYSTITKVMTTSHLGPDTIMISLPRASTTATATATATPSWMTPGTTIDPRTASEKDTDMMNLIRNNGETLIMLAILATMFGLIKMIMK